MCNFKNCQGPHACFLRDISPCPEATVEGRENIENEALRQTSRVRSRGFLDQEELIAALGVEDVQVEQPANENNVSRVSSKIMRVAEALALRKAS